MLLLDTHALLWLLSDDDALPSSLKEEILFADRVYVSIASFWEIAIKKSLGKLDLSIDHTIEEIMDASEANDIVTLPLKKRHFSELMKLEYLHRDPFDRIIIAQSIAEGLTLISKDTAVRQYAIDVRWA